MNESGFAAISAVAAVTAQRRRTRAEADRVVAEFERSGMERREFCAAHGLSVHTLDAWRRRSAKIRANGAMIPVELVEGRAAATAAMRGAARRYSVQQAHDTRDSHGAFRVQLAGGRRIEVDAGFDAAELKRLIAALEAA